MTQEEIDKIKILINSCLNIEQLENLDKFILSRYQDYYELFDKFIKEKMLEL